MKTILSTSLAVLLTLSVCMPKAQADPVTAGTIRNLLNITSGLFDSRPSIATAPYGESIVAWVELGGPSNTMKVSFLGRDGSIAVPAAILATPGQTPQGVAVAATPFGFMLAYNYVLPASVSQRIAFITYDLSGSQLSTGSVPVQGGGASQTRVLAAGTSAGEYALAWGLAATAGNTRSIYFNRYDALGAQIDFTPIRADDAATLNFGNAQAPAIAMWPSRRVVVAWHDGTFNAAPSGANSPDGQGQGILARWFDPSGTPVTPPIVANQRTANDQFDALITADDRDGCYIGWCGDIAPNTVDAWVRRFDDAGNARDPMDTNLTPTDFINDQLIMGIATSPSGDWVATYMNVGATTGQPAPRAGYVRFTQGGSEISRGFTETGGLANQAHTFPRVGMDDFGRMFIAYQAATIQNGFVIAAGVRTRRYERAMVAPTTTSPTLGQAFAINLDSPSDANNPYILICSSGQGPFPLDTRTVPLALDALADYILFQGGNNGPIFFSFFGLLDGQGRTSQPAIIIPNLPQLSGITLYLGFATGGPAGTPSGVNTISHNASFTIQ